MLPLPAATRNLPQISRTTPPRIRQARRLMRTPSPSPPRNLASRPRITCSWPASNPNGGPGRSADDGLLAEYEHLVVGRGVNDQSSALVRQGRMAVEFVQPRPGGCRPVSLRRRLAQRARPPPAPRGHPEHPANHPTAARCWRRPRRQAPRRGHRGAGHVRRWRHQRRRDPRRHQIAMDWAPIAGGTMRGVRVPVSSDVP